MQGRQGSYWKTSLSHYFIYFNFKLYFPYPLSDSIPELYFFIKSILKKKSADDKKACKELTLKASAKKRHLLKFSAPFN